MKPLFTFFFGGVFFSFGLYISIIPGLYLFFLFLIILELGQRYLKSLMGRHLHIFSFPSFSIFLSIRLNIKWEE